MCICYRKEIFDILDFFPPSRGCNIAETASNMRQSINSSIDFFFVFSLAVGDRTVCAQPQVVGRCRAAFPRYWFNSQTNRCERFTYGGCGGNENNFKTLQECQRRCQWKLCKLFITAIIEYSVYLWYRRLWQFHVLWIDTWAKIFFCEVMKWYFVDQNM